MKYKILVFDLDDTLIDNRENVRTAFRRMLEVEKRDYSDEEFERWYRIDRKFWSDWRNGLVAIPERFSKEDQYNKSDEYHDWIRAQRLIIFFDNKISEERAIELNNIYMAAMSETIIPIDGATETLRYLHERDYTIIVATNGPDRATQHKIDCIGASDYVTEILAADAISCMKPDPFFFTAIEKRYGDFDKTDYLMIGDSLKSDVGFSMNVGIDSCWLDRGGWRK